MTDRVHTLTVVLEQDVRVDDIEGLQSAIRHMRGVLSVTGMVADFDSHMAEERVRREARSKILTMLEEWR